MTARVKICGLRTVETLEAALQAGADYFGLVFYRPSPRDVDMGTACALAAHGRGRAKSVALLVDPDDAAVERVIERLDPDLIQLHGTEPPERVRVIRRRVGRPVVKAIKVAQGSDAAAAAAYRDAADIILFDAKVPADATDALPGGNGVAFDWQALAGVSRDAGFILSGGLTPDNVQAAIEATGASVVDVSSGVERAPGDKDPELIRRFVTAAKAGASRAPAQERR